MSERRPGQADAAASAVASHLGRRAALRVGRGAAGLLARAVSAKMLAAIGLAIGVPLVLACVLALALSAWGAAFQHTTAVWPVPAGVMPDGSYRAGGWAVASGFGWRASPLTGQVEFHDGIDIISPDGGCPFGLRCALPAMLDGVVTYVGWDQPAAADAAGGGQVVVVENGQADHSVLYAHLEPYRLHVQLQGRVADPFGRYDADYRPVGVGALTPGIEDGTIELWCAPDMPIFRATRSGPATVTFVYDRPAQCRTSVRWGAKGGGWEGWVADEPAAGPDGRATLAWQTPLVSGQRAGDVALRFRAHLVPPPPAPTATPTPAAVPDAPARSLDIPAGQGGRCERQAGGVRCVWQLASIPPARSEAALAARGAGSAPGQAREATPAPAPLVVVASAAPARVPTGGRFTVTVALFSAGGAEAVPVTVSGGDQVAVRAASATSGACTSRGGEATCRPRVGLGSPATLTVVFEILPGAPDRVAITARAAQGDSAASDEVVVEAAGYAVTPGPWPPLTATPEPPAVTPVSTTPPAPPPGTSPGDSSGCPAQALVPLPGVLAAGRAEPARLIAPAAQAFQAARAEVAAQVGRDALARLADALRPPEFRSDKPGVARRSWHMTGRAVDLDTGAPWQRVGEGRLWRLFLAGVDVTAILERHGFRRIPDRDDSAEWWHYEYRADGVAWASAMLQVWPLARLERALPEVAWASVGCAHGAPSDPPPPGDAGGIARCTTGAPAFARAVEELLGCGPPLRVGDHVWQLDTTLGFVGTTGSTTGPHLHLGLRVRGADGAYHQTDVCTPDWLQGAAPPADAACWTEMADPLAFLPLAPPGAAPGLIEGAPWQLPPPDYPGSLLHPPAPGAPPTGQYWSPFADGGRYGGGGALQWFEGATCAAWGGFPWCPAR